MDGFTYNNIFETKGIEYLAIIAFFAILIPFWLLLNKQVKITRQIQKTLGILTAQVLRIPQGLFYSSNHTWTFLEKSGIAKVGLDDLLLHITGEVKLFNLKKNGESIKKGEVFAEIEHQGKVLQICSPVSGEIINFNAAIIENPGLLNDDPYEKGWMFKIKPLNWISDTNTYHLAEEATQWSANELERFKDFLSSTMPKYAPEPSNVILQDGGELRDHTLSELPSGVWEDFQKNFLNLKE
jgi:glycine cleavage system H protein